MLTDTDITALKIYFSEDEYIKVHQIQVSPVLLASSRVLLVWLKETGSRLSTKMDRASVTRRCQEGGGT